MRFKFQIPYVVEWRQFIFLEYRQTGQRDSVVRKMETLDGNLWEAQIELDREAEIQYNYFVGDENENRIIEEFNFPRRISATKKTDYQVFDKWRSGADPKNNLLTSPFVYSFFKREKLKNLVAKGNLTFDLLAPRVSQNNTIGILGSARELGEWDTKKVKLLNPGEYPNWKLSFSQLQGGTIEYKYVLCDKDTGKFLDWEVGENRKFDYKGRGGEGVIIHDEDFRYFDENWRGAGVAIPVFSLRSKNGSGIGEFEDLKLLTDWALDTGLKVIQVLPVNDTTATHTWVDSYPYSSISVQALHPIYLNLKLLGEIKDKRLRKRLEEDSAALNSLSEVDYEGTMKLKWIYFREIFKQEKSNLKVNADFNDFVAKNSKWLKPYAVFCYLRDKNGTADFSKWGEDGTVNSKKLASLTSEKSDNYEDILIHYFIQFHLDRQLKSASEYARSKGVVLKGDIPIGVYRNSVDAWMEPESFNMDCQSGAPPDDFSDSGQNWGFPTYNWEKMAETGFSWWRDRLIKMADYFDIFRIDHILGFFRIWEIPQENVDGVMGRFNPALPFHTSELEERGLWVDRDRYCKPFIRDYVLGELFSSHSDSVRSQYFDLTAPGCYEFKSSFDSQRKVDEYIGSLITENPNQTDFLVWIKKGLFKLHGEVLLMDAPKVDDAYNPRINLYSTYPFKALSAREQNVFSQIHHEYFFNRHNDFWRENALKKLPAMKRATNMLICGEDLGMVPASVPGVMKQLNMLSLAVQRMPSDNRLFWHPKDTEYSSVTTTSSHDTSTLRGWWEEDPNQTRKFFNNILGHEGDAPYFCEPWVVEEILDQHLQSPSMFAIFPIQDFVAMDKGIRRELPSEERINVPADPKHFWKYRMHLNLEELIDQKHLSKTIKD